MTCQNCLNSTVTYCQNCLPKEHDDYVMKHKNLKGWFHFDNKYVAVHFEQSDNALYVRFDLPKSQIGVEKVMKKVKEFVEENFKEI